MDFETHLEKYLTKEEIQALINSLNDNEVKHALVLNIEKISIEQFKNEFPNIKEHPIVPNVFLYDSKEYSFGKHIYHELGYYYIFEPCSSIVSYLLDPKENDIILDIAAAPGGKSIHTSLMMKNQGILISNEIQHARSFILSSNVERMGRKSGAIGFALYLDLLEELDTEKKLYDVDTLIVYDDSTDVSLVMSAVKELTDKGLLVSAQKAVPQRLRYREVKYLSKEGK